MIRFHALHSSLGAARQPGEQNDIILRHKVGKLQKHMQAILPLYTLVVIQICLWACPATPTANRIHEVTPVWILGVGNEFLSKGGAVGRIWQEWKTFLQDRHLIVMQEEAPHGGSHVLSVILTA